MTLQTKNQLTGPKSGQQFLINDQRSTINDQRSTINDQRSTELKLVNFSGIVFELMRSIGKMGSDFLLRHNLFTNQNYIQVKNGGVYAF